uniref:Uncharacterized protein n=1 Tax=Rhizophora mucronata TaxID=61149 RepID=A0A2P2PA42_RHIMU
MTLPTPKRRRQDISMQFLPSSPQTHQKQKT